MASGVNGPFFVELAKAAGQGDLDAVDTFRKGGDLAGVLKVSGNGNPIPGAVGKGNARDIDNLRKGARESTVDMMMNLRLDAHADRLLEMVETDAKLGRMSKPVCLKPAEFMSQNFDQRCYSKAFTVDQGWLCFCFLCSRFASQLWLMMFCFQV